MAPPRKATGSNTVGGGKKGAAKPRAGTTVAGPSPRILGKAKPQHTCVANSLHTLNVCFIFFALGMIIAGIYFAVSFQFGSELFNFPLPYAMIGFGVVLLAINVCGCQGALKRKRKCLFAYFVTMLFLVLVEACFVILAIYYAQNLQELLYQSWIDASPEVKDRIQAQFNCCGYYNAIDHIGPLCENQPRDTPGCSPSIQGQIQSQLRVVFVLVTLAAVAQIFGVGAAVVLIQKVDELKALPSSSSSYEEEFDAL